MKKIITITFLFCALAIQAQNKFIEILPEMTIIDGQLWVLTIDGPPGAGIWKKYKASVMKEYITPYPLPTSAGTDGQGIVFDTGTDAFIYADLTQEQDFLDSLAAIRSDIPAAASTNTVHVIATLADTTTIVSPVEADIAWVSSDTIAFRSGAMWRVFSGGTLNTDASMNGDGSPGNPLGVDSTLMATVSAVRDTAANIRLFHRNVYHCEDYGAHVDTTDNSPKIQAAIDAAAANGGGIVKLTTPGVYTVASVGSSCYTNFACIIMKDSIDLVLGQGVTLKMADDQWNDTGTVRVVVIAVCDAENFSISGGKIDGNAAGQTTWTGGYEQAKAFGIQAYQCNAFEVRDMDIINGLSNPINFHSCYDGEVVNMYSTGCGEGPEWQRCWNFDVRNYVINDSTDVAVGDGFELSGCRKFNISGVNISENGLGAAIDLYGSTDIVVSGFFIHNWNGVGISYNNPAGFRPLNINISDGIIRGSRTQNGIQPNGNPGGSSMISNVVFDSLQFGIYMVDNAEGYTLADDCVFKSNLVGVRMECNDTLYLKSSLFTDNTYAVQFDVHPSYTLPVLVASDCDFYENSTAFYYSGDGANIFTPKFYVDGGRLLDNTSDITYSAISPNDTIGWIQGDYISGTQKRYAGLGTVGPTYTDNTHFVTVDGYGMRQQMPIDSVDMIRKNVEANTAGSGMPNALTDDESSNILTNQGSTAQNYHTLPTAAAGLTYTFVVQDTDGIRIVANTGDTIRVAGAVSASAGYTESTTIGDVITLVAINATEWIAISYVGTWTTI